MKKYVYAKFKVDGLHCWPEAPNYLKHPHRHLFYFELKAGVGGDNREIEFIKMGSLAKNYVETNVVYPDDPVTKSCEQMAIQLILWAQSLYGVDREYIVKVEEDGENGAEVFSSSCSCR